MKYKQRIVCGAVALPCMIVALFAYFHFSPGVFNKKRSSSGTFFGLQNPIKALGNVVSFNQKTGECPVEDTPKLTADWLVDEMYDEMNFTTNARSTGGLYVLHEKDKKYKSPPYRKSGKEKLTVIVVPHSHNDPGWLWTLDTYYNVRTRHILTNTVRFLLQHPDFKMIWTEMVFLDIWWKESSQNLRNQFKDLVQKGQIEILSGGWVSVDEATTHYTAVLDQLVEGHMWVQETLGVYPNISWSIDPFGYSTSLPYLWYKSGMKDMAILRLHGALKQYMGNRHVLTFNWRQFWDSKGDNDILCHVEPYTLYAIEYICGPDQEFCKTLDFGRQAGLPQNDNDRIPIGNGRYLNGMKEYAEKLVEQYRIKADHYRHNVLLMPHGDDFRYIMDYEFQANYDNMKRIMDHVNKRPELNVHMKFGTVGEYFDMVHESIKEFGTSEKSVSGDFFTYTDRDDEYWSGYYTSRPFDKRMIRYMHEILRTAEIFLTYAQVKAQQNNYKFKNLDRVLSDLQAARRTHGLVQHHDAITGTSAANTVKDFENRISSAIETLKRVLTASVESILLKDEVKSSPELLSVDVQKQPDMPVERRILPASNGGTRVILTNSHSQERSEIISLIVNSADIVILDQEQKQVEVQVNPCWSNYDKMLDSMYEAHFPVRIPAMGFAVYTIKKSELDKTKFASIKIYNGDVNVKANTFTKTTDEEGGQEFKVESNQLYATFSRSTGLLQQVCMKGTSVKCTTINLDWIYYDGDNNNAYCFGKDARPNVIFQKKNFIKVVTGKLVTQITINHPLLQHSVSLYHSDGLQGKYVYIENVATLIHADDKNKELLMRISSSIKNEKMQYYTDENSFQFVSRQTRSNYPMAANIFPITSHAFIQDKSTRLNVHSAQPVGVGSFRTGSLEFLIDRVPTFFGKGLDEAVTDNKPTLSKFIIHLEDFNPDAPVASVADPRKRIDFSSGEGLMVNDMLNNPIFPMVTTRKEPYPLSELTILKSSVPCDLSVANFRHFISNSQEFRGTGLTFHQRKFNCNLRGYSCKSDKPANLYELFKDLKIKTVKQMSLTHLHESKELQRGSNVEVNPMELESFYIQWE